MKHNQIKKQIKAILVSSQWKNIPSASILKGEILSAWPQKE